MLPVLHEYRVTWKKLDKRGKGEGKVLFVKAETSQNAIKIAEDYIERNFGIIDFFVTSADKPKPIPEGSVVTNGKD